MGGREGEERQDKYKLNQDVVMVGFGYFALQNGMGAGDSITLVVWIHFFGVGARNAFCLSGAPSALQDPYLILKKTRFNFILLRKGNVYK